MAAVEIDKTDFLRPEQHLLVVKIAMDESGRRSARGGAVLEIFEQFLRPFLLFRQQLRKHAGGLGRLG